MFISRNKMILSTPLYNGCQDSQLILFVRKKLSKLIWVCLNWEGCIFMETHLQRSLLWQETKTSPLCFESLWTKTRLHTTHRAPRSALQEHCNDSQRSACRMNTLTERLGEWSQDHALMPVDILLRYRTQRTRNQDLEMIVSSELLGNLEAESLAALLMVKW